MNPDSFRQAWRSQPSPPRLTIDAELLVKEVRRNQRHFTAMIFWRDVREVGTGILMVPLWLFMGVKFSLPWTWYLALPALLWIAGFMLTDRMRQSRRRPKLDESIRRRVEYALAEVEHQIWLLRNVIWWCLLPCALGIVPFFCYVAWKKWTGNWLEASILVAVASVVAFVFIGVYWLNQRAVRTGLQPRSQELRALLASLTDD